MHKKNKQLHLRLGTKRAEKVSEMLITERKREQYTSTVTTFLMAGIITRYSIFSTYLFLMT